MLAEKFGNQTRPLIHKPHADRKVWEDTIGNQNHLISINDYGQKKQAESLRFCPTVYGSQPLENPSAPKLLQSFHG
jgi:hypothetical protein